MTSDRWEYIFTLFDAALARPEAERAAFLSDHCGEDAHLREEVESLLAAHGDADGFLSGRPARAGAANVDQSGPASPSLTRGKRLGVFDIEGFVGAGGMGEVYRAHDTRLDRHVAIKVLLPDAATDPRGRARFAYEARAIARLSHPRICSLHEMGHQDGVDFLVMEYLEGETLAARLRKGPMPLTQALRTAIEIAEALAAAHAQGIVHRDLKPGNVMLTAGGAKLLDFGLARLRAAAISGLPPASRSLPSTQTAPGLIVGTLPYMAPEQLEGNEVDARADIFAFGAVLYEMITGRKAFEGASQASVISAILSSDPPAVAVLQPLTPPALDQVIHNCLAKDRNDRWASAHDVLLQLEWIAGHLSAVTVAAGVPQNRRRELLAWTIAAMAGLALVVLWAWSLRRPTPDVRMHVSSALPPPGVSLETDEAPAISPDGSRLLFVGHDATGKQLLYTLALDVASPAKPLANTDGASLPFWSPDSQSVGFFGQGKLKTVDIETGQIRTLADAGGCPRRHLEPGRHNLVRATSGYRFVSHFRGRRPAHASEDREWRRLVPLVPFIPAGRPAFSVLHSSSHRARERWSVCRLARFEYGEAAGHRSITCGSCNARISSFLAGRGAAGASLRRYNAGSARESRIGRERGGTQSLDKPRALFDIRLRHARVLRRSRR